MDILYVYMYVYFMYIPTYTFRVDRHIVSRSYTTDWDVQKLEIFFIVLWDQSESVERKARKF